ncbi:mitochondrial peripheral inner membrane protein [Toensbergia leucococca]|nr:mitochondrial peripheral inner membrane protein [Toensbergia leucococca]
MAFSSASFGAIYLYHKSPKYPLDPETFSSFILVAKERVSQTSSIFTLQQPSSCKSDTPYQKAWKTGIWSVQVKQPQLQIARSYTPVPPLQSAKGNSIETDHLRFLIRREPAGEVSGYLHRLSKGAVVDIRGPHIEYEIPEDVAEVVFLAGGTGIVPALQLAYTLFHYRGRDSSSKPKIHILWANRSTEDCLGGLKEPQSTRTKLSSLWSSVFGSAERPLNRDSPTDSPRNTLVNELESLSTRHHGHFKVDYFVDEKQVYITEKTLRDCFQHVRTSSIQTPSGPQDDVPGKRVILISGPDGFVKHYAGAKKWKDGKEVQGNLGGVLRQIVPRGWETWKL